MKACTLIAIALLAGCATVDDRHHAALASFAAASVADAATTNQGLDRGCTEQNPLLGSNPDDGALIVTKLAAYAVAHWAVSKTDTSWWLWPITAITAGVAINNHGECR